MAEFANTKDGFPIVWSEEIVGPQLTASDRMVEYKAEIAVCAPQVVKVVFTVARRGGNPVGRSPEDEREDCKFALREYVTQKTQRHLAEFGLNPIFVMVDIPSAE